MDKMIPTPTNGLYRIVRNERIARDVYELRLSGDTSALKRPGQFVNIRLDGLFLRRPISVCTYDADGMTLIYKVVGAGTRRMAAMRLGATLDLLVGLGNGFDIFAAQGKRVALIGGGVGLPPLYGVLKALLDTGVADIVCAMGFASAADVFYEREFAAAARIQRYRAQKGISQEIPTWRGADVRVATVDGSHGARGFVTDALRGAAYDYYFACGPMPMLRAVHALGGQGQLSFEERMGCGFGACMACTCQTLVGAKRVCVDGPVFDSAEVMFA